MVCSYHDEDQVLSTLTDFSPMKGRYLAYNKIASVLAIVSDVLTYLLSLFFQVLADAYVTLQSWSANS